MRLTSKARYAVTAMVFLALHGASGRVTLAELGEQQGVSLSYLEQLFAALRRAGLVSGVRGPGGGYRLARAPAEISVADIISAVDARVDLDSDLSGEHCLTHELWSELSGQLYLLLDGMTLDQLAREPDIIAAWQADAAGSGARGG